MFKALPILGAARVCVCVCVCVHMQSVCVCVVVFVHMCVCGVEIINGRYKDPASLRGPGLQGCCFSGAMGSVHLWPRLHVLGSSSIEQRNRAPGSLETAPRPRSRIEGGHVTHLSLGSSKP